jgi:hypothetical protein
VEGMVSRSRLRTDKEVETGRPQSLNRRYNPPFFGGCLMYKAEGGVPGNPRVAAS